MVGTWDAARLAACMTAYFDLADIPALRIGMPITSSRSAQGDLSGEGSLTGDQAAGP